MGPLVPEIFSNEFNFVIALLIGICFGFILEQAGFSTSKKLVGLFYGYDFTVLRVFFTAGVTAMIGVLALAHFGMLDVSIIYINPTYLWSGLIGGGIMGLGFILGGFCPGTSFCAAAIGKIDAMFFILGSFIGVFFFAEGYGLLEGIYKAEYWGNVQVFETVGISQSLFAFLLTAMAVFAFWATTLIESKVNGKMNPEFKPVKLYIGLTGLAIVLGLSSFILQDRKTIYLNEVEDEQYVKNYALKTITVDELAFRLIDNDASLQILDFRPEKDYTAFNLPRSHSFTIDNLFGKEAGEFLLKKNKRTVFIADNEINTRKAAIIADKLGYADVSVLKGGLNRFITDIIEFEKPGESTSLQEANTFRFREKASRVLPVLIKENQGKGVVKKKPARVLGGC